MFVSHNPPFTNPEFASEMQTILTSQPMAAAYVLNELSSNEQFLDAAYHGSAMLEGQDGTTYTLVFADIDGNSLWEARWMVTLYTSVVEFPITKSFLFQVKLPTP